jgi:23S rRNA pseudouridine1911/1915/1917 synthase
MGREDYKRRGKVIERDWDESFVAPMSATVPAEMGGLRLDQALARLFHQYSRNRLQAWLQEGHITIDGKRLSSRHAVTGGESVVLTPPQVAGASPRAQRMPLKIAYEDADLIVIDKPVGLVVHPGAGQPDRTLMNGLLAHAPALAGVPRAGIVHRLDKDTSGLLVVAKTVEAQTSLVEQLASRSMKRTYLALVQGDPPATGVIDAPLGRDPRARTRMAVTHQIRVHFQHIRHPLVGDTVYRRGTRHGINFPRQALHAAELSLVHPRSKQTMTWSSPLPKDMKRLLDDLRAR